MPLKDNNISPLEIITFSNFKAPFLQKEDMFLIRHKRQKYIERKLAGINGD